MALRGSVERRFGNTQLNGFSVRHYVSRPRPTCACTFAVAACLNVEPVVFLRRQREQRFPECPLDGAQRLLGGLPFFGLLLCFDEGVDFVRERSQRLNEGCVALIVDDAAAGSRGQIEEWCIDQSLQVARTPRPGLQSGKGGDVLNDSGPARVSATRQLSAEGAK